MSIISHVLEDFYHCTHITIHYLDKNKTIIEALGDDCNVSCALLEKDIPETQEIKTLVYPDHIHYIVLPFYDPLLEGWFVAGPFQSDCYCESGIVYKPAHCTHYFEEMLTSMVKRHQLSTSQSDPHVAKAIKYIHDHYKDPMTLDDVCHYLGLNKHYFCTLFKGSTGATFINFLNKVRIDESCHLLTHTSHSMIDIALSVGFNNPNYFSLTFKKLMGLTPTVYRKQKLLELETHD